MSKPSRPAAARDNAPAAESPTCRVYLITPPRIETARFAEALRAALDGGDVACVQLRLKDAGDDQVLAAATALMPICHQHDVAFLINDRPDLAVKSGADGVHVGQTDATYGEARAAVGERAIVGVTCHDSRHLAIVAAEQGADYVAFGAFFPTNTKEAKARADLELLRWWDAIMQVPSVAIGGLTPQNAAPIVAAGADFLAASAAVWNDPDGPAAAVAAFNRVIAEGLLLRPR